MGQIKTHSVHCLHTYIRFRINFFIGYFFHQAYFIAYTLAIFSFATALPTFSKAVDQVWLRRIFA